MTGIDINFLSNFKWVIVIHIIVIFENDCMNNSKNESNQIIKLKENYIMFSIIKYFKENG